MYNSTVESSTYKNLSSDLASLHSYSTSPPLGNGNPLSSNNGNSNLLLDTSSPAAIDIHALDAKSIGYRETDLSRLSKQTKFRPGGSLSSAASQHLKKAAAAQQAALVQHHHPLNSPTSSDSRLNSLSSMSSYNNNALNNGNKSPLNQMFGFNSGNVRNNPSSRPVSPPPSSFRRSNPQQQFQQNAQQPTNNLELIAMQEKIKYLEKQVTLKDEQLRKSLSMQNSASIMDKEIMQQYDSLEEENIILGKDLNEKNQELVEKLQEIQEKDRIIKEMEDYSDNIYNQLKALQEEKSKESNKLQEDDNLVEKLSSENEKLKKTYALKVEEHNKLIIQQRHNIKFEYDAIIENKMKAVEKLRNDIYTRNEKISQLWDFMDSLFKDINGFVPSELLKEKASFIDENFKDEDDQKHEVLHNLSSMIENSLKNKEEVVDKKDLLMNQNNSSFVSEASHTSSMYSKHDQSDDQGDTSSSKIDWLNADALIKQNMLDLLLVNESQKFHYEHSLQILEENLMRANYMIAKLSYLQKEKNQIIQDKIRMNRDVLLKNLKKLNFTLFNEELFIDVNDDQSEKRVSRMNQFINNGPYTQKQQQDISLKNKLKYKSRKFNLISIVPDPTTVNYSASVPSSASVTNMSGTVYNSQGNADASGMYYDEDEDYNTEDYTANNDDNDENFDVGFGKRNSYFNDVEDYSSTSLTDNNNNGNVPSNQVQHEYYEFDGAGYKLNDF